MSFDQRAEDDAHNHWRRREVRLFHKIADHPEDYRDVNLGYAIVSGIRSGDGDHQNEGQKLLEGDFQQSEPRCRLGED